MKTTFSFYILCTFLIIGANSENKCVPTVGKIGTQSENATAEVESTSATATTSAGSNWKLSCGEHGTPCIYGNSCLCHDHYMGEKCDILVCEYGKPRVSGDEQWCVCYSADYYGKYCQYRCEHGKWLYLDHERETGRCQCLYGWTGTSCDIPHPYTNSYQSYTASIIFLCLAAFLAIACVLCIANKRRRQRIASSRASAEALNRSPDQRQYGSFYEGQDNSATNNVYGSHPPPPPLPKYEDALKLPVYVAPVIQNTSAPQPPPYAEISTITEIVTISHNRNSIQNSVPLPPTTRPNETDERTLPRQTSLEITNDNFV